MNLHRALESKFPNAIKNSCRKEGCRLQVRRISGLTVTVIDADKYAERVRLRTKICDYLVFVTDDHLQAIAIEMKSGSVDARSAVQQIESGAQQCDRLAGRHSCDKFHPVLLSQGKIHATELKVLMRATVRFRGNDYLVKRLRCGAKLEDVLRA